jgi:hypothetical protein
LLCGGHPQFVCVWTPNDQAAVEAPRGKTRVFVYAICRGCQADPGFADRADDIIKEVHAARNN